MSSVRPPVRILVILAGIFLSAGRAPAPAGEFPRFEPREIDPHVGDVCYAVALADVDNDTRPDIVAVTENRVLWYHNPDWTPRVMIADATERDNVCIAPYDIDGDGQIDFALGAGWLNKHLGTIHWISRGKSIDDPWHVHAIGRESWTHRMRWGDLMGSGRPQLVVTPLNKTVGEGVRILAYEIPESPKTDPWRLAVVDESLNAVHNHWMGDLDGDGRVDLVTASMEGVFLFQQGAEGRLRKTRIGEGAPGEPAPQKSGAGEIKVGRLKGGRPYLATVEPMHGQQIVVYLPPAEGISSGLWKRHVLDDTLRRGHALGIADIDRDGTDELVVGHSDQGTGEPRGPGVFVYDPGDDPAEKWTKHVIDDGGIATEDLAVQDLDGDGWPDVVAGGRATHNLKIYMNLGSAP